MHFLISLFFNALLSNYIERSNMNKKTKKISIFGSKTSSLAIQHRSRTVKGLLSSTAWSFPVKMKRVFLCVEEKLSQIANVSKNKTPF